MKRRFGCTLALILLLANMLPSVSLAKDETVEEIGDYLQFILPIAAWGSTFIAGNPEGGLWDREGTRQATLSIGSALATMMAAKYTVAKTRPGIQPPLSPGPCFWTGVTDGNGGL